MSETVQPLGSRVLVEVLDQESDGRDYLVIDATELLAVIARS